MDANRSVTLKRLFHKVFTQREVWHRNWTTNESLTQALRREYIPLFWDECSRRDGSISRFFSTLAGWTAGGLGAGAGDGCFLSQSAGMMASRGCQPTVCDCVILQGGESRCKRLQASLRDACNDGWYWARGRHRSVG
jgi:hypothetical protein